MKKRPRGLRIDHRLLLLACITLMRCGTPSTSGNTNWLMACTTDSQCGEFVCQCNYCEKPCQGHVDCIKPPGSTCTLFEEAGIASLDAAPDGFAAVAIDASAYPSSGVCGLAPRDTLPPCTSEVRPYTVCDGSTHACMGVTDGSDAALYVCQNLADGIALEWTEAHELDKPCQDRQPVECPPQAGATDQQLTDQLVETLLAQCLGNESWVSVSFGEGCAKELTLSGARPDQLACMQAKLGNEKYSCAVNVSCSGALLSTLR
jgi:hypothetical protein